MSKVITSFQGTINSIKDNIVSGDKGAAMITIKDYIYDASEKNIKGDTEEKRAANSYRLKGMAVSRIKRQGINFDLDDDSKIKITRTK